MINIKNNLSKLRNFSLLLPDLASSFYGILIAPIGILLTREVFLLIPIIAIYLYIFSDQIHKSYHFLNITFLITFFLPLFISFNKSFHASNKMLYMYLFFMASSFLLYIPQFSQYFYYSHILQEKRFVGFSMEPSFMADTFFPVFIIALNLRDIKLKFFYIYFLIIFFLLSGSKTFIENILILFFFILIIFIFKKINLKTFLCLFSFLFFLFVVILKNTYFFDFLAIYHLEKFNSWRLLSNFSAIISSEMINLPWNVNYDNLVDILLNRFRGYDTSAIFSILPFNMYFIGVLPSFLWAFIIIKNLYFKSQNLFANASYLALTFIFFALAPKWNFVYLYALLAIKNLNTTSTDLKYVEKK